MKNGRPGDSEIMREMAKLGAQIWMSPLDNVLLCDRDEYVATKERLESEWKASRQVGGIADAAGEKQK